MFNIKDIKVVTYMWFYDTVTPMFKKFNAGIFA